jgi:CheY-like chemotaxis protein/anti-sigma regulatory factor (Ser/Thr protein kinase)
MAAPECERCAVITLLDVDPDLYVSADRDRLRQVALNLFSNAAKYNQAGGTITITSARVDSRIRFAVADSGRGIDPRRLDELFTPFSRLGAEKSKIEGTGLGLTVSKAIVGEMDGTLTVESTGPNGTTFVVDLPAAERADVRPRDMRSAGSDNALLRSTARIVYIEDNVDNVELLESVLARHSHVSLLVADDGQSGLALVHEAQPDVVVLDLHLPDMSGRDVLIALKADVATSAIPVVVLTADVLPGNANELRGLGAAAFVTKPFEIKFMLNVLSQQLNKREMVTR